MLVLGGRGQPGYVMARSQGGAFTPLALNPALWFDASQISGLSDGDSVTTWSDMSESARHATQSLAAAKPTYKTGIVGGQPVVRFDGGDMLEISGTMALSALTAFIVFRTAAAIPSYAAAMNFYQSGSARWMQGVSTEAAYRNGWAGSNSSLGLTQPSGAFSTSTAYVQIWKKSTTQWTIYRNGTAGSAINDSTSAAAAVSCIGCERLALNQYHYHFTGDIAEIIIYATALSDADRQAVEAYLSAKFGIALA